MADIYCICELVLTTGTYWSVVCGIVYYLASVVIQWWLRWSQCGHQDTRHRGAQVLRRQPPGPGLESGTDMSVGQCWGQDTGSAQVPALLNAGITHFTSTKLHSFRSVFAASGLMQGSLAGRPGARKHRNRVKMTPVASLRETIESEGQGWN